LKHSVENIAFVSLIVLVWIIEENKSSRKVEYICGVVCR